MKEPHFKTDMYRRLALASGLFIMFFAGSAWAQHHGSMNQFSSLFNSVQTTRAEGDTNKGQQDSDDGTDDSSEETEPLYTAAEYYAEFVDPIVQAKCLVCHQSGLVADSQGARLLFPGDSDGNQQALYEFVNLPDTGADWLLGKISNEISHGGGRPSPNGSTDYNHFSEYLTLAIGANTGGPVKDGGFWDGTAVESRETTLRRAAFLLSGRVPSGGMLARAEESEEALRTEIRRLMNGDGFHDFIVNGANDRLLISGLNAGIDWQFDFWGRFPEMYQYTRSLPSERPPQYQDYHQKPFLTSGEAEREFRFAVSQEPLELIAYVIENGRPYTEIVTADYTLVNAFSSVGYRADARFETEVVDAQGFFDRRLLTEYKPGQNKGHIPHDEDTNFDDQTSYISFSGYHDWPHAGVLSTPAWMGRYPSTDTNRNRARARWTYFHFLGVDIEKSAPRSTDQAALADKNNPTMNNPACTVCHERMDPVAGAYQSFGDQGHYLDQWGGKDSLADSYKRKEKPVGELQTLTRDPSLEPWRWQKFTRQFDVTATGSNHVSLSRDPEPCIQDEERSTDEEWVGWCSQTTLQRVAIYRNGELLESISASQFESDDRFSIATWIDQNNGNSGLDGHLGQDDDGEPMYHFWRWIAFDFSLDPGEYMLELDVLTSVDEGFPRDSTYVGFSWNGGFSEEALYQYGDTWYRDMRTPGFEGKDAAEGMDSIQWLGRQIAEDPRFPKATVKFWWPAVFGDEALEVPENPNLPNYQAKLSAYNEQQALITELADRFVANNYNAKELFADMLMSRWYRTSSVDARTLNAEREVALETVGSGRLLTPEELDRKTKAVFGRAWGERAGEQAHYYKPSTNLTQDWGGYSAFYGGIDGATVTKRNRDLTALMSNVVEKMAIDLSCQVVQEEFFKPRQERSVLKYVEKSTDALTLADETFVLNRNPEEIEWRQFHGEYVVPFRTDGGGIAFTLRDTSPEGCTEITDENSDRYGDWSCSHMGIEGLEIRQNGVVVESISASEFSSSEHFRIWLDASRGHVMPSGWLHRDQNETIWFAHTNEWFALDYVLDPGSYEVAFYLASGMDQDHPVNDVTVEAKVMSNAPDSNARGSRQLATQIEYLYETATTKKPSEQQVQAILGSMTEYAAESQAKGDRNHSGGAHCDGWWNLDFYQNREDFTDEDWRRIEELETDSNGMMRAWAMVFHSIMTSHAYMHD